MSMVPDFEWDLAKDQANQAKHGISFQRATALWRDPALLTLPSKYPEEPRLLVIGRLGSLFYTAVVTFRGDTVRIISVRRSRQSEELLYERNRQA